MSVLRTTAAGGGPTNLETRAWVRSMWRSGPESWVWAVSLAAWLVLCATWIGGLAAGEASIGPLGSHDHGASLPVDPDAVAAAAPPGIAVIAGLHLAAWAVMVAATMLPLIAPNLRTVGLRSPRGRRTRATLETAGGWAVSWVAVGVVACVLVAVATAWMASWVVTVAVCLLAIGWQFAPVRRVAMARSRRFIAPSLGSGARAECARFGVSLGWDGVVACWPTMVLMTAAGHHPVAVIALAWLSWRDMRRPHDRPGRALSISILATVGALALLVQS